MQIAFSAKTNDETFPVRFRSAMMFLVRILHLSLSYNSRLLEVKVLLQVHFSIVFNAALLTVVASSCVLLSALSRMIVTVGPRAGPYWLCGVSSLK